MLASEPVVGWLCIGVLAALALRSLVTLSAGRLRPTHGWSGHEAPGGARTGRFGEAAHAAMALGMAGMVAAPMTGAAPRVFEVYFAAGSAVEAAVWLVLARRRWAARARDATVRSRPAQAHALGPHHAAVGLAMAAMAAAMAGPADRSAAMAASMSAMAGMAPEPRSLGAVLATLALGYVWIAVLVLGGGLAKVAAGSGAACTPPPAGLALLGAPVTVYACELAMTVVMGLMLLG
jgi:hypothetical protein